MSWGAQVADKAVQTTVGRLAAAPKYRQIHVDTIADVVRQETAHAKSEADLERRARLKLHKIAANYLFTARPGRLLRGLDEARDAGATALRSWCRTVLASHYSTAERLGDLGRLYPTIFEVTGAATSVVDLACALNPFTLPWLGDVSDAAYTGYDLNLSYVEAGSQFLARTGLAGTVRHREVLVRPEEVRADVALLLKTYHCIEDRRPGAALRLVEDVAAEHVVVSFPLRTMSGRSARFAQPYIEQLVAMARGRGWDVRRATLTSEELVVVVKDGGSDPHA